MTNYRLTVAIAFAAATVCLAGGCESRNDSSPTAGGQQTASQVAPQVKAPANIPASVQARYQVQALPPDVQGKAAEAMANTHP